MNFKKFFIGFSASLLVMTNGVYAVPENDTTATGTTAATEQSLTDTTADWQTATTTTTPIPTTTTTTTTVTDAPMLEPATVKLEVGEVKDMKFSVKLVIDSEALVSSASISVEFDKDLMELVSTKQNEEAGGMAVENTFEGKYVYNYVNADGSEYKGAFVTLNFEIIDEDMTSSVLYLSVTSLDNNQLKPISFTTENGIVTYKTAEEVEAAAKAEARTVKLQYSEDFITLESLGITDVKECTVENGQLLICENNQLKTLAVGETMIEIIHSNDKKEYIKVVIEAPATEATTVTTTTANSELSVETEKVGFPIKKALIISVIIIGVIVLIVEYFLIIRPLDKKTDAEEEDETDETDDKSDGDNSDKKEENNVDSEETGDLKEESEEEAEQENSDEEIFDEDTVEDNSTNEVSDDEN